ncbi:MAG TPA: hypothetical protein VGP72_23140 [Planctomycetota bacterium]|jgi:cytochrome b subunit of formate dehydrogenase
MYSTISIATLAVAVALVCAHALLYKPKSAALKGDPNTRLGLVRVLVYLGLAAGFLSLIATGFVPTVAGMKLHGWILMAHVGSGPLFIVCLLVSLLIWGETCCLTPSDFSGTYPVEPAPRCYVGQKITFWCGMFLGTVVLISAILPLVWATVAEIQHCLLAIHRYSALALIVAGIVHAYLLLAGRPGVRTVFRAS